MDILTSLLEAGGVTESEVLVALHKSGSVDVLKLLKETVKNKVSSLDEAETKAEVRAVKEALIDILDMIEEMIDEGEEETENEKPQTSEFVIPVVG